MPTPAATRVFLLVLNCLLFLSQALLSLNRSSVIILNTSAAVNIPSHEAYALLELKARLANSAASQALLLLRAWNASNLHNICKKSSSWPGVTCNYVSGQPHITGINLTDSGFAGSLPPHLGNLTFLSTLDLSSNLLTGRIPAELSGCSSLQVLDLHNNSLTGTIPPSLGSLATLQLLRLCRNNLSGAIPPPLFTNSTSLLILSLCKNALIGSIPTFISSQGRLQKLFLGENNLTGVIPSSLGNCTSLVDLELHSNQLSGHIPHEIGLLRQLTRLSLSEDGLGGAIPSSLGNCTSLVNLELDSNQLSGHIPREIGLLRQLTCLSLAKTGLGGAIPSSLGMCKNLLYLELRYNKLRDEIPKELGALTSLTRLFLSHNSLTGEIPGSLGNCTSLVHVELQSNELSGSIPTELGQLANLQDLRLWENKLDGIIPETLANCTGLINLDLAFNELSGFLPTKIIMNLKHLQKINLRTNRLLGFQAVPVNVSNATSLILLDMSSNQVSGKIPAELGQLKGLQVLILGHNQLTGNIPWNSLSKCTGLYHLDLSNNQLAGGISIRLMGRLQKLYLNHNLLQGPIADLRGLSSLLNVDLSFNHLNGTLPDSFGARNVQSLDFSHNHLSGNLPPWLGMLLMVEQINLSRNKFVGIIPNLGDSLALQILNVSGNLLTGEFPLNFNNKSELILDLSSNGLTGLLPSTLGLLQHLKFLNVSFNSFEGPIPSSGVFEHLNASCFQGNPGLCGEVIHKPCNSQHRQTCLDLKIRILIGLTASLVVPIVILFAICYYRYRQKSQLAEMKKLNALAETKHFSAKELWESTQGYSEGNLLGEGAVGKVYKGVLSNGEVVAVKKIKDEIACSREAVLQEVHILSKLRHRNLVKVLGCVLNLEDNALVMEFMPNGSLEQYLYQGIKLQELNRLSWEMKLQVAQGVANALAYLHHEHDAMPIIHGDVKPSNILLDSELQAHLADFGLAKLAKNSTGDVSLTSNSFKGSIGYMAPEFAYAAKITTKVDIYSFGVVILEMMTGRGPLTDELPHGLSLHDWVKQKLLLPAHDVLLQNSSSLGLSEKDHESEARLVLQMAVACTEELPNKRPTMQQIKAFLNSKMV